jgi:hypothetical protein
MTPRNMRMKGANKNTMKVSKLQVGPEKELK